MKLANFGLSIACAGALALTQVAVAQTSGGQGQYGQQGSQTMKLSRTDKDFLKDAAETNLSSIKAGQLAQQKATDPNVKRFAQQQVQTHQNMYNQLNQFAQMHNVTLPTKMSSSDQREYDRLTSASGNEFDKDYTRWSADKSQKAVESFQKEAENGQNPTIKNYASTNLSTIQNQMQTAQGLERSTSSAAGQMDGTSQQQSDQHHDQSQPDQSQSNPY
jgi:putative membrane protein